MEKMFFMLFFIKVKSTECHCLLSIFFIFFNHTYAEFVGLIVFQTY